MHRLSDERFAGFAGLADATPSPIFLIQENRLRYVNRAFAALTGHEPGELLGLPFGEALHADDRIHLLARVQEQLQGKAGVLRLQFRVHRKDGGHSWVYATTAPIVFEGQAAVIGNAIEISERRQAQDAVAKSQRLEAVGRLAGGVAHDFNNVLQVILGHAERVLATLAADAPLHESAVQIKNGAERAAQLTDTLLSLGQRQLLEPETTDLGRLVSEVKDQLQRRVGDRITLVLRRANQMAPVRVDRARLLDVLFQLVDNARDAMPTGGQLLITTEFVEVDEPSRLAKPWLRVGAYMHLHVEDSGLGMEPWTAAHAFEPFFTTKPRGTGAGLGLATVYGLVKQSNGFTWIESTPSAGTRVSVLLPADGPARSYADAERGGVAVTHARGTTALPRVLLVEDEPGVRELLAEALRRNGFDVVATPSAEDALPLTRQPFEILLTDISLPGMNGVQLAHQVSRAVPKARILLMSGYAREEFLSDNHTIDDWPFIGKPFTTRAIVERLRGLLEPAMSQRVVS